MSRIQNKYMSLPHFINNNSIMICVPGINVGFVLSLLNTVLLVVVAALLCARGGLHCGPPARAARGGDTGYSANEAYAPVRATAEGNDMLQTLQRSSRGVEPGAYATDTTVQLAGGTDGSHYGTPLTTATATNA